jgi:hypothetical protein
MNFGFALAEELGLLPTLPLRERGWGEAGKKPKQASTSKKSGFACAQPNPTCAVVGMKL